MKVAIILLIVAAAYAAPVDESSVKEKRGLSFGLGYHHHEPLLTHSHYVAPAVVHSTSYVHHAPIVHAPIISHHAPIISHHAPIIAHHPISYHSIPSYHSYHHYK